MLSSTISSLLKPLRISYERPELGKIYSRSAKKLASGRNNDLCFAVSLSVSACGRQGLYVVTKTQIMLNRFRECTNAWIKHPDPNS
jgi:hypothetical protein